MWTNLNPVNESEEFISNWRIQKSKDNGSDIIAQPRSTSFLTFCQFRWTFTGSSELAWAAKNYCQNAITVHDTTGPSWKPTKLNARNENVKEVSDEQHSLVWFWCATLIITWKKLKSVVAATSPKVKETVYFPSNFAFVVFLRSFTSLHHLHGDHSCTE